MAELVDLFDQHPRPSVTFLRVLLAVGAGSTIIATPPSLYVFATSRVETGPGCPWLRGWLLLTLLLQWAQFPYRALLYYKLIAIGRARLEDIAGHLGGIVRSKQWHIIKVLGYAVYTMFAVGVVISWYFASNSSAPDYLRSTVMIMCLSVVLRMIFSFGWFFYMFMYTDELPFLSNPRGASEHMLANITRFKWAPSEVPKAKTAHTPPRLPSPPPAASLAVDTRPPFTPDSEEEEEDEDGTVVHTAASVFQDPSGLSRRRPQIILGSPKPSPRTSPHTLRRRLITVPADTVSPPRTPVASRSHTPRNVKVLPQPQESDVCPVCLVEYEAGDEMAQLPCYPSHVFHYDCVMLWFKQSTACPMCASDIADSRSGNTQRIGQ